MRLHNRRWPARPFALIFFASCLCACGGPGDEVARPPAQPDSAQDNVDEPVKIPEKEPKCTCARDKLCGSNGKCYTAYPGQFQFKVDGGITTVCEDGKCAAKLGLSLNIDPAYDVTVSLAFDADEKGVVITPPSIVFTPENWNEKQFVQLTGHKDGVITGDRKAKLHITAASDDSAFDGLSDEMEYTVREGDRAGVAVEYDDGLYTSEDGAKAVIRVHLILSPSKKVTIPVSSSHPEYGVPDVTQLVFTPENAGTPQTITVTGQDVDGTVNAEVREYSIVFGKTVSEDAHFRGLSVDPVFIVHRDNDGEIEPETPRLVTIHDGDLFTSEDGDHAFIRAYLSVVPTQRVVIPVSSTHPEYGVPDVTQLEFSPENATTPQTITVTGQDDDGEMNIEEHSYEIVFGKAESQDPRFDKLSADPVHIVHLDNDDDVEPYDPVPEADGVNCNAGWITVSESQVKNCTMLTRQEDIDGVAELAEPADGYYCVAGRVSGRYCRYVPADVDSRVEVRDGQVCTAEQKNPGADTLRIHIIDVANGDAIWIQTPTGQNVLIDGGDLGGFNAPGGQIVTDYLEFHGFPKGSAFDAVFLSHPHSDHYGGFPTIFKSGNYTMKNYIDPMEPETEETVAESYNVWIQMVTGMVTSKHLYMPADRKLLRNTAMPTEFFGDAVKAEYLFSRMEFVSANGDKSNPNTASIIFRLTYAGVSMLFTGDATDVDEESLLTSAGTTYVPSNFLKVCHHGSDTSSSQRFLDVVWKGIQKSERGAYISSGRKNFSGTYIPAITTLSKLANYLDPEQIFSTSAGDDAKVELEAYRDDNILIVVKSDGTHYSCYSGPN